MWASKPKGARYHKPGGPRADVIQRKRGKVGTPKSCSKVGKRKGGVMRHQAPKAQENRGVTRDHTFGGKKGEKKQRETTSLKKKKGGARDVKKRRGRLQGQRGGGKKNEASRKTCDFGRRVGGKRMGEVIGKTSVMEHVPTREKPH